MKLPSLSPPLRLALIYLLISSLWVLFSDRLLEAFVTDTVTLSLLQTFKGWLFVLLTALLLYALARHEVRAVQQKNRELEAWSAELEQRVAQRTAELKAANEQLRHLDEFKSNLIDEIAHELRSPMTSIGLRLDMLQRVEPGKQQQYIDSIKEQLISLRDMLNDFLDMARLDKAPDRQADEPVDLALLAQDVVEAHRPIAEATGLTLLYEYTPPLPHIWGRREQLSRVITNLVANAIKYTRSGYVKVMLSVDAVEKRVALRVEDTGIGIAPEDISRLFDRFYRAQRVKQMEIPGTGLGLSIVKEIVESHKGSVTIESQVNQGSAFTVYLPLEI